VEPQGLEYRLEELYQDLSRYTRQMDEQKISQTRKEIRKMEQEMDQVHS
jgi:hypothetical protein